jgi:hypothetical protein
MLLLLSSSLLLSPILATATAIKECLHAGDAEAVEVLVRHVPEVAEDPGGTIRQIGHRGANRVVNAMPSEGTTAASPTKSEKEGGNCGELTRAWPLGTSASSICRQVNNKVSTKGRAGPVLPIEEFLPAAMSTIDEQVRALVVLTVRR